MLCLVSLREPKAILSSPQSYRSCTENSEETTDDQVVSLRLFPVRPCWRASRNRQTQVRLSDKSCHTRHRTEIRILPSLLHVAPSAASGRLSELLGFPISCPFPLST